MGRSAGADFASRDAAEQYRHERHRAALEAGDEVEARRFEKLVPIGCPRGVHDWHRWPAGFIECSDCGVEPQTLDAL